MFNRKGLLWVPSGGGGTLADEVDYFAANGENGYTWTTITEAEGGSGRSFARCLCDQGTIMKWDDNGVTRYTIVLDTKYRIKKTLYSSYTTNLNLPTYTGLGLFSSTGAKTTPPAIASNFTDTTLVSKSMANQDSRSSKVATITWINCSYYGTDMPVIYYLQHDLQSKSEVMTLCDLPTINCLTRIYGDMTLLDSFDSTSTTYKKFSLSSWFQSNYAWSSSWYGNISGYYYGLAVLYSGRVSSKYQNETYGVIPVLELHNNAGTITCSAQGSSTYVHYLYIGDTSTQITSTKYNFTYSLTDSFELSCSKYIYNLNIYWNDGSSQSYTDISKTSCPYYDSTKGRLIFNNTASRYIIDYYYVTTDEPT